MSNVRWNFRLGPIQINSRFGAISWGIVGAVALVCCCGGLVGSFGDDETPARPAVKSSALVTTAPPATQPQVAPSPTKSPVAKSSPAPKRTASATPSPTRKPSPPAPKNDPRFDTCKEANANGYGPYVEGEDPEFEWYRDRDGDGMVCEPA